MTLELENATGHCEFLEKENKALMTELDKARQEAREARSESGAIREEVRQAKEIVAGKPFLLQTKFGDPALLSLTKCGVLRTSIWTCRRVLPMRRSITKCEMGMQRRSFFGRSLAHQSALCCSMNRCPNGPNFTGYPALP